MDLDALLLHYFEAEDPSSLDEVGFARGVERLKIGFGIEREPGRRFALWTLLEGLGEAPLPADAFARESALKAAAEEYLKFAFRAERRGNGDA